MPPPPPPPNQNQSAARPPPLPQQKIPNPRIPNPLPPISTSTSTLKGSPQIPLAVKGSGLGPGRRRRWSAGRRRCLPLGGRAVVKAWTWSHDAGRGAAARTQHHQWFPGGCTSIRRQGLGVHPGRTQPTTTMTRSSPSVRPPVRPSARPSVRGEETSRGARGARTRPSTRGSCCGFLFRPSVLPSFREATRAEDNPPRDGAAGKQCAAMLQLGVLRWTDRLHLWHRLQNSHLVICSTTLELDSRARRGVEPRCPHSVCLAGKQCAAMLRVGVFHWTNRLHLWHRLQNSHRKMHGARLGLGVFRWTGPLHLRHRLQNIHFRRVS